LGIYFPKSQKLNVYASFIGLYFRFILRKTRKKTAKPILETRFVKKYGAFNEFARKIRSRIVLI